MRDAYIGRIVQLTVDLELRMLIFGFHQTSKALYTDTRELLARYGIYRIVAAQLVAGKYVRYSRGRHVVSDSSLAKVQNLEMSTRLADRYKRLARPDNRLVREYRKEYTLQQILNLMERPMNCYIKLRLHNRRMMEWEEIAGLSPLRSFKTVTVEMGYPGWQYKDVLAGWEPNHEYDEIECQRIIKYLKIVLGTDEGKQKGPELKIISTTAFDEEVRNSKI